MRSIISGEQLGSFLEVQPEIHRILEFSEPLDISLPDALFTCRRQALRKAQ